uniref:t-SNARE coiled-coil homology domain-containing protein n=1 Tax=Ananas comosus var. bracteatus TaxID=296719 RepID=A0A6V7PK02_ANACO|nr:unnamed protein product [Ananas comosus var. bracteatus]
MHGCWCGTTEGSAGYFGKGSNPDPVRPFCSPPPVFLPPNPNLRGGRCEWGGGGGGGRGRRDPSQAVASGVFQINTAVATFQRLVNTLGTPKDTPDLRDRLHKTRAHITQLIKDTSDKLRQASEADHRSEVSASKKIADAKLAKDFQSRNRICPFVSQAALPPSYNPSESGKTSDKSSEQQAMLLESRRQEVLFLDNEIVFNEAIIEEREQGIQEIQQQIGEVNEIFKDLAVLVHDQGAMIDDIDSHIESSVAATAQAKTQLSKAAKTQKSNSSLVCLLLVIFGVVLLIVIIVLAA